MNGTNYEVPHCEALSTTHSDIFWAYISCFKLPLAFTTIYSKTGNIIVLYILMPLAKEDLPVNTARQEEKRKTATIMEEPDDGLHHQQNR